MRKNSSPAICGLPFMMRPFTCNLLPRKMALSFFFFLLLLLATSSSDPTPSTWPHQFHSTLFMNNSGSLQVTELWYDWPNGRNFNIIQNQLGKLLYDLEWDNGTSYIYTTTFSEEEEKECRVLSFPVGILRPDWLAGAEYLGQRHVDGFLCNVWTKVEFIWYYEDVVSKRPVHWVFYTGMKAHVMTFEVGAVLEDANWQAPLHCFTDSADRSEGKSLSVLEPAVNSISRGAREGLMRGIL